MLTIRPVERADLPFLRDMLLEALYVAPGEQPYPPAIVDTPEIARYLADFRRPGDEGVIAMVGGQRVGAAWSRLWTEQDHGYGFVDETTPELTVAVVPDFRGRDIGTMLLEELLTRLDANYEATSLSVHPRSHAVRLYQRLGYSHVDWVGASMLMVRYRSEISAIAL